MSEANEPPVVRFAVDDDTQAAKISALLVALGYEAVRDMTDADPDSRRAWLLACAASRYGLTERERVLLSHVAEGLTRQQSAELLDVSRATIKWHLHNLYTKTGTANDAGLLRLLLDTR